MLRFREFPASNLGLDSGYPDRVFAAFHSPSKKFWYSPIPEEVSKLNVNKCLSYETRKYRCNPKLKKNGPSYPEVQFSSIVLLHLKIKCFVCTHTGITAKSSVTSLQVTQ
jgi:hypothetical protein